MISLKNSAELVKDCSKDVCKSYYTIAENSAAFLPPSPEFDGTANVKQQTAAAEVDAEEQVQEEQDRRKEHRTHTTASVINHSLMSRGRERVELPLTICQSITTISV